MQTPEDVKARVALAYDNAADFYDHPANRFWDRAGRKTVERLGVSSGSRVLDVCCGAGASALAAAELAGAEGRVLAVDLSEALIRLGREKAARRRLTNIEFRLADMLTLEPGEERFDHVVCVFGLFFVPDMVGALRHLGTLMRTKGSLAVTAWGQGLFEPLNSIFWDAVRSRRPELYKSFNPWDRLGDEAAVRALFESAGMQAPQVELESGTHEIAGNDAVIALLMGTGYRGVLERMAAAERGDVVEAVLEAIRADGIAQVNADVIYAACRP